MAAIHQHLQSLQDHVAIALPRRGLSRVEAALYVGVSPTKFDQLVKDSRMPGPKRIDGRVIWDRLALDIAFDDLPSDSTQVEDTWADFQ